MIEMAARASQGVASDIHYFLQTDAADTGFLFHFLYDNIFFIVDRQFLSRGKHPVQAGIVTVPSYEQNLSVMNDDADANFEGASIREALGFRLSHFSTHAGRVKYVFALLLAKARILRPAKKKQVFLSSPFGQLNRADLIGSEMLQLASPFGIPEDDGRCLGDPYPTGRGYWLNPCRQNYRAACQQARIRKWIDALEIFTMVNGQSDIQWGKIISLPI